MENKTNIAKILKDCPTGMELDCILFKDTPVYFHKITTFTNYPIEIKVEHPSKELETFFLNEYGAIYDRPTAKCVIYPKGKTTWKDFQIPFEDGDILVSGLGDDNPFIFKQTNRFSNAECYCAINCYGKLILNSDNWTPIKGCRIATEEKKQKLFDIINESGYKWNAETKTLEKLSVPSTPEKFYIRIGDIPSEEKSAVHRGDAVIGYEDGVSVYDCIETDGLYRIVMPFPLKEGQGMTYECLIQEITQCRYEIENPRNVYLVSGIEVGKGNDNEPVIKNVKILKDLTEQFNTKNDNTEETKTLEKLVEPKFKVGDKIVKKNGVSTPIEITGVGDTFYYSCTISDYGVLSIAEQDDWELVPNKFDISTLKPFDKVLIRSDNNDIWECDFFSLYNPKCSNRFHCVGAWYNICIPYKGNEHLRGTTDDCDEFYKNWE